MKTASVITDSAGNIKEDSDYYPWGGELQFTNADTNHYKFTGKERDTETGLDYFGARYYANVLGRWNSPDWSETASPVPYAEASDPQSLNLYAYARNIPTTRIDEDGHEAPLVRDPEAIKKFGDTFSKNLEKLERAFKHPAVQAFLFVAGGLGGAAEGGAEEAAAGASEGLSGLSLAKVADAFKLKSYRDAGGGFIGAEFQNGGAATLMFGKSESSLTVGVSLVAGAEKSVGTLYSIESGAQNLAKAEGASSLTIIAKNVTNEQLANILKKDGFTQEMKDGQATGNWTKTLPVTAGIGNEKSK